MSGGARGVFWDTIISIFIVGIVILVFWKMPSDSEQAEPSEREQTGAGAQTAAPAVDPWPTVPADPTLAKGRCPYCHAGFVTSEPLLECPGCRALFHAACVAEIICCTTLGCEHQAPPQQQGGKGLRA